MNPNPTSQLDTNADNDTASEYAADKSPADLTQFQTNCLFVIAAGPRKGLAIKDVLSEEFYHEEVLHGRLYPNLDTLRNKGLIDKHEIDGRTNEYAITAEGRCVLADLLTWQLEKVGTPAEARISLIEAALGGEE